MLPRCKTAKLTSIPTSKMEVLYSCIFMAMLTLGNVTAMASLFEGTRGQILCFEGKIWLSCPLKIACQPYKKWCSLCYTMNPLLTKLAGSRWRCAGSHWIQVAGSGGSIIVVCYNSNQRHFIVLCMQCVTIMMLKKVIVRMNNHAVMSSWKR